jgi:hypothetical protein
MGDHASEGGTMQSDAIVVTDDMVFAACAGMDGEDWRKWDASLQCSMRRALEAAMTVHAKDEGGGE